MILFIILAVLITQLDACGGGSGCCQSQQPPPVASCGSGCQPGYSCGTYGCTKRRVLSSLTRRIDGVIIGDETGEQARTPPLKSKYLQPTTNVSIEQLMNPNFIFHSCCEARGLPDSCLHYCHFDTYTANALERMYRKEDKCPIEAAHEIHYCAAQGIDHTKCCARSGVADTVAGDKCLSFCDQRPNRLTPLDVSYLPCYDIFENMKRCFFTAIRAKAQEKFGKGRTSRLIDQGSADGEF
ncbi:unnamed protein product [Cylicocyclus nassatus]|uniref:Domain of unknown function DB domain-containing protein n=1 Tax=Cylicocyclus nassatus TaxID=53992 RepID=A0AA36GUS5_CYLNA|nr:unnamed protein product [Cylicocyclus nassatus]